MRKHRLIHLGPLFVLLLPSAAPGHAQTFDVVALMSPNQEGGGKFGISVSRAGDVNQDGFADVIVGAPNEDPGPSPADAGRAYILSGEDGRLLFELTSPNQELGGEFGSSVSGAGDVNQDGFPDVVVGAYFEDPGTFQAGRAYVFSGQDGSVLLEFTSPNEESVGLFGYSVAGAGDVNQDGYADVIVGAYAEDPGPSPQDAGRAYVFSGQDGSLLFELVSPNQELLGRFGWSVSGAGDVNQDGFADLIVGAFTEDPGNSPNDSGRAYVFSGHNGSVLLEFAPQQDSGFFGYSVSAAGDVNQDGFADVIVGAVTDLIDAGSACVFSGADGRLIFKLVSPNAQTLGIFGHSVSGAGDVNQDGFPDVIVGAPWEEPGPSPEDAGRAYVFSGQDGSLLVELVSANEEVQGEFGTSVSGVGDVDQDGFADMIVGAYREDAGSTPDAGRAYVFVSSGGQPQELTINAGGPNYTDTDGRLFVADQAYAPGSFGHVGGKQRTFSNPIGGTQDDPLYQDLRLVREGTFSYLFDVSSAGTFEVTLYLMAPELSGPGRIIMDVRAEGAVVLNDLNVSAQAGGIYRALTRTFVVNVTDGRLDLSFEVVNKAAVVSAIAVVQQHSAR